MDQNTTINVEFELRIYNIISIDEPNESINLLLWTTALWIDEFLAWNPADFNGCTAIKVHADQIWTPDIYFVNSLQIQPLASTDIYFVSITNNGSVRLALKLNAILGFDMMIDEFPFDTQHCPITVGLWTYNYSEVVLNLRYPVIGLAPYNGDPNFAPVMGNASEFETVSFSAVEVEVIVGGQSYAELQYILGLKRMPSYYIFVLLIPTHLLASLCIIGIFTPNSNINERNERVTLGLTTLLSMSVILNIVASEMPKGSSGLPRLGVFVLYEIGICTLAIILSTIIIVTHQRSLSREWKPTKFCYWIATARANISLKKHRHWSMRYEETPTEEKKNFERKPFAALHESCSMIRAAVESIDSRLKRIEEKEYNESVWQICFDTVDECLLVSLFLINTIVALRLVLQGC